MHLQQMLPQALGQDPVHFNITQWQQTNPKYTYSKQTRHLTALFVTLVLCSRHSP